MKNLLAMFSLFPVEISICPICEEEFDEGQLVHRECLKEKHGGELPEGFEELISAFELD